MPEVTVLGAGGATVTISLTSADNAAAAQSAVDVVNSLTSKGLVDMQISSGAASLPAPQNFLAGTVLMGNGFSGTTGDQYLLIGASGKGENAVLGGQNFRTVVVAGNGSDLSYGNQSQDGQVWLGDNKSNVANFEGKVTVNTEAGDYLLVADKGTTNVVNLGAGGTLAVTAMESVLGATTVNAAGAATVTAFGSSTVPVQMNLTKGDALVAVLDTSAVVINPGAANATVLGDAAGHGSATLFGGSGSVLVADLQGHFTGGSAGNNIMFSSTVTGSSTLVGGNASLVGGAAGAPVDILVAQGAGQTLTAGIGNASLIAVQQTGGTGGSTFNIGAGFATVLGYEGGGNIYSFFGYGAAEVFSHGVEASVPATAANLFFDTGVGTGSYVIADFVSGFDVFQVTKDFTITFVAAGDAPSGIETTTLQIAGGATFSFFDATADGVADIKDSDVTKLV